MIYSDNPSPLQGLFELRLVEETLYQTYDRADDHDDWWFATP